MIANFFYFLCMINLDNYKAIAWALSRRAQGHHSQAAGWHGRHWHLPGARGWAEPGGDHRDAQPGGRPDGDGAEVSAGH